MVVKAKNVLIVSNRLFKAVPFLNYSGKAGRVYYFADWNHLPQTKFDYYILDFNAPKLALRSEHTSVFIKSIFASSAKVVLLTNNMRINVLLKDYLPIAKLKRLVRIGRNQSRARIKINDKDRNIWVDRYGELDVYDDIFTNVISLDKHRAQPTSAFCKMDFAEMLLLPSIFPGLDKCKSENDALLITEYLNEHFADVNEKFQQGERGILEKSRKREPSNVRLNIYGNEDYGKIHYHNKHNTFIGRQLMPSTGSYSIVYSLCIFPGRSYLLSEIKPYIEYYNNTHPRAEKVFFTRGKVQDRVRRINKLYHETITNPEVAKYVFPENLIEMKQESEGSRFQIGQFLAVKIKSFPNDESAMKLCGGYEPFVIRSSVKANVDQWEVISTVSTKVCKKYPVIKILTEREQNKYIKQIIDRTIKNLIKKNKLERDNLAQYKSELKAMSHSELDDQDESGSN
jgi:hypothetical protein